jgi:hypothetical protein
MLFNERLMQFLTAENVAHRLQPYHEEFRAARRGRLSRRQPPERRTSCFAKTS